MINTTKRLSSNGLKCKKKVEYSDAKLHIPLKNKSWVNEILIIIDMY